jgi:hypothetical protein
LDGKLGVIATGIAELPSNLAKSIASLTGASSAATGQPVSDLNKRLVLLSQLDHRDYIHIVHWSPDGYTVMRKHNKNRAKKECEDDSETDEGETHSMLTSGSSKPVSTLSCYMEDENGRPILEYQRKAARHRARLFWNELFKQGKAPPSGQKVDLQIRDEFVFLMEDSFPWLRYCANHWKADRIWINHYPGWYRNTIEAKAKAEAKARAKGKGKASEVIDLDSEVVAIQDIQEEPPRRRREDSDKTYEPKRRREDSESETNEPKRRRTEGEELAARPRPLPPPKVFPHFSSDCMLC